MVFISHSICEIQNHLISWIAACKANININCTLANASHGVGPASEFMSTVNFERAPQFAHSFVTQTLCDGTNIFPSVCRFHFLNLSRQNIVETKHVNTVST